MDRKQHAASRTAEIKFQGSQSVTWRNGTSCNVKEPDGICTVGICKKSCNLSLPICRPKMQGHLRCQERLWMWILPSQKSGAGEFDFDYPTELMHFASFCIMFPWTWLKKIQQLCISESWKKMKNNIRKQIYFGAAVSQHVSWRPVQILGSGAYATVAWRTLGRVVQFSMI